MIIIFNSNLILYDNRQISCNFNQNQYENNRDKIRFFSEMIKDL